MWRDGLHDFAIQRTSLRHTNMFANLLYLTARSMNPIPPIVCDVCSSDNAHSPSRRKIIDMKQLASNLNLNLR